MAGQLTSRWIVAVTVCIVAVVVADIVRRAWPVAAPAVVRESLTPAPAPAPPVVSSPPAAGSVPAGPGYIEQLARAETRRRLRASAGVTYLNDFLATSADSMLHRWDNRITNPVRVYLAAGRAANYQPEFADAVRWAFARWESAGVPVRFNLLADSSSAEVSVRWRIQFDIDRSGQTDLTWNADGHIETGVITLATFDPQGRPMAAADIRVVALHEVGHVIGLDHSLDSTDLMYAVSRVGDLSDRDVQSARLLYALSPGSIR